VFQVLAFVLSIFVWVWRGRVWPLACDYPRTTTRGRKPCRNRVFGEWSRCHLHRRRWRRATDSHVVGPTLRRWETIRRGVKVERTDLEGSGFLRRQSNVIGVLYRKGFARPPRDVIGLVPQLVRDYRQRFGSSGSGSNNGGAGLLLPRSSPGRPAPPGCCQASSTAAPSSPSCPGGGPGRCRRGRSTSQAAAVMLLTAWGYAAFNAVKSEIPGWLVAIAFLMIWEATHARADAAADGLPGSLNPSGQRSSRTAIHPIPMASTEPHGLGKGWLARR
jgi:hypothetical protein